MTDKVLVSTITQHNIEAPTVQWLLNCGYPVDIIQGGSSPVVRNRNTQVAHFLLSEADYLFIVDRDTVPPSGIINTLLASSNGPKEIHVAPSWMHEFDPFRVYPMAFMLNREGKYMPVPATISGKYNIDAAGMSGALIPRRVFDTIGFRDFYADDGSYKSEDFCFWEDCKAAGYAIIGHFDQISEHIKRVPLGVING